MDTLTQMVKEMHGPSVMVGDFNLPGINWMEHTATGLKQVQFLDACEETSTEQLVTFPTQVKGDTLDLVLTNIPHRVLDVEDLGRLGTSDHSMIQLQLSVSKKGTKTVEMVPNWFKADWGSIRTELQEIDLAGQLLNCDTDIAWSILA
jgi:hypothetical protein